MDVRVGPWRKLRTKELMLLNCGVREDSWDSLGMKGDQTSQSSRKSVLTFIGRTDAEAEAPVLWPPDMKSRLTGKDPDAGKDWRQDEKGATDDEMVGWHHQLKDLSLSKLQEMVKDRGAWCAAVHGVPKSQTGLCDWTTTQVWILMAVTEFLRFHSSSAMRNNPTVSSAVKQPLMTIQ